MRARVRGEARAGTGGRERGVKFNNLLEPNFAINFLSSMSRSRAMIFDLRRHKKNKNKIKGVVGNAHPIPIPKSEPTEPKRRVGEGGRVAEF